MNARVLSAIALSALSVAAPMSAEAVPYHVVYDATVTDGSDVDNIFGLVGQSLAGLGIRADVTYFTSGVGTRATNTTSDEVYGGDAFGTSPVIPSAVFTIGAKSFTFYPAFYGDVYTSAGYLRASGYDTVGNSFQTYIEPNLAGPGNLQTLFSSVGVGDAGGAGTQYSYAILGNDLIDFDTFHVTVSAVPEPTTWGMMLIGLGALGYTMRRHRKSHTAAIV